jgi:hypothetical protein
MKLIVMTTAIALSLAAPAFAAGQNTVAQDVALHFAASETGSGSRVYFGDNNGVSARAAAIFAELNAEDTGTRGLPILAGSDENMSSKGGQSAVAAAIFAEIRASENGDDR